MPGNRYSHMALVTLALSIGVGSFIVENASAQGCGEWTQVNATGPGARSDYAMTYDPDRDVIVLFGGEWPGDTWEWDGSTWTQVATSGPRPRRAASMVYDTARHEVVLFGGVVGNNDRLGDTWTWDSREWKPVSQSGPTPRGDHAMAFDESRGIVVLYGGSAAPGVTLDDTWEWDGASWTEVAFGGPPSRYSHAMAYDSVHQVTVMFGGRDEFEGNRAGTWEWDGEQWAEVAVEGPPLRFEHDLTFDSRRQQVVLFGGRVTHNDFLNDTWSWDGVGWEQVAQDGPSPRSNFRIEYVLGKDAVFLFGGGTDVLRFDDTWQWNYSIRISRDPQDQIAVQSSPVSFGVEVEANEQPSYQWRRNGVPLEDGGSISGAHTDTLMISRVFRGDEAAYDCVVSGTCGEVRSRTANLDVVDPALAVAPTCPGGGPISISWQYTYPNRFAALLFAINEGTFRIPAQYMCPGTRLGLGANRLQIGWQGGTGTGGDGTINGSVGPAVCGGYSQLLDLTTCVTSNVVHVQ